MYRSQFRQFVRAEALPQSSVESDILLALKDEASSSERLMSEAENVQ